MPLLSLFPDFILGQPNDQHARTSGTVPLRDRSTLKDEKRERKDRRNRGPPPGTSTRKARGIFGSSGSRGFPLLPHYRESLDRLVARLTA